MTVRDISLSPHDIATAKLKQLIDQAGTEETAHVLVVDQVMALVMMERNRDNRTYSKAHGARLSRMMTEKRFMTTNQGIGFDRGGRLRDGQHRLTEIANTGIAQKLVVVFGLNPAVFDAIDTGMKRAPAATLKQQGHDHTGQLSAMTTMLLRHELKQSPDAQEVVRRTEALLAENDYFTKAATMARRVALYKQNAAIGLAAYRLLSWVPPTEHGRLDTFWDRFVEGHDLTKGDPILDLRNYFGRATQRANHPLATASQYTKQSKYAAAVILAANAWSRNEINAKFRWSEVNELPEVNWKSTAQVRLLVKR
jgi:hypothetical protein